jgi:UDP-N-acetylglucosamine--N-acetylmuramyl-(pentapeptide) pyrophosphoryl-undecaprenol N-acetylglucosamine transferase
MMIELKNNAAQTDELKNKILIMAGGTGGHVFPALAVANALHNKGIEIHWMGTRKGIEANLVPENKFELHLIDIAGIRGKSIRQFLVGPLAIFKAILQAKTIINKVSPKVILGMGGYASGPGGIAALLCSVPLIVHEQNARAGTTNKILAKIAKRVLCGFPNALPKGEFVGNPVRESFYQQPAPNQRYDATASGFKLLILGGSLGAKALNELVPAALELLPSDMAIEVRHQAGEKSYQTALQNYQVLKGLRPAIEADVTKFIADVAGAMAAADLIICRAGALTVAELSAVGAAAILVPFPYAIDDHQAANARWLSDKGAAVLCAEKSLSAEVLAKSIQQLLSDRAALKKMATLAYERKGTTPTMKVVDYCLEYMNV